ncbi:hypothetical protein N2152v2_007519 [Parachlorella kessleri]
MAFNWFLVIVTVVVAILTLALSVYLIVIYQHPEDKNQAWFPKLVVLLGFSVAIWTVLLFPLDVANNQACTLDIPLSSCSTTFPMKQLWWAIYITNIVITFVLVPFSIFFYEADSDTPIAKRWLSGFLWALGTFAVIALIISIPYAVAGYAEFPVQGAWSGMISVNYVETLPWSRCVGLFANYDTTSPNNPPKLNSTLVQVGYACNTKINQLSENLTMRVSYITYAMCIYATVGWLLFMVFGAIGLVALPLDWIRQFIGRPTKTITKSEYIARARDIARRAKDIRQLAEVLKREEREQGKGRRWRKNFRALQNQMLLLEEDEEQLELVYPQSEDPDYKWAVTVMMFYVKFILGLISLGISITWVVQVILYVLIDPPASPFLNEAFVRANDVFTLFGTLLFGIWCFYLQLAVIKGNFKFGLNLLIFKVHPMRPGATIMSSFLFNIALILLATTATIQFCSVAFAQYADGTEILNIFGNQLTHIRGIKYLYTENIFIYCWLGFIGLTLIWLIIKGPDAWKRHKVEDAYAMD